MTKTRKATNGRQCNIFPQDRDQLVDGNRSLVCDVGRVGHDLREEENERPDFGPYYGHEEQASGAKVAKSIE